MSIAMPPSRTKMTPSIHRVAMCDCRTVGLDRQKCKETSKMDVMRLAL